MIKNIADWRLFNRCKDVAFSCKTNKQGIVAIRYILLAMRKVDPESLPYQLMLDIYQDLLEYDRH